MIEGLERRMRKQLYPQHANSSKPEGPRFINLSFIFIALFHTNIQTSFNHKVGNPVQELKRISVRKNKNKSGRISMS